MEARLKKLYDQCLSSATYFLPLRMAVNKNTTKISNADSGSLSPSSNTSLSAQTFLDLNADFMRCAN